MISLCSQQLSRMQKYTAPICQIKSPGFSIYTASLFESLTMLTHISLYLVARVCILNFLHGSYPYN